MGFLLRILPQGKTLAAVFMLIPALVFLPTTAFAHARLLRSRPAAGEGLQQAPKMVQLTFSERLQNVNVNSIVVTDRDGRRVDQGIVVISEDGKSMLTELDELSGDGFEVEWKALSVDDHTMKGNFAFRVALSPADQTNAGTVPDQSSPGAGQAPMRHEMPMQESGTTWPQSIVRWQAYLAMIALFGGFAFQLFVLRPSLRQASDLSDEERALGVKEGTNHFLRLTWLSLALLAFAAFAGLILQTSAVLDVSLAEAFVPLRMFEVLTGTAYGAPWLLGIAALLALLIVSLLLARRTRNDEWAQGSSSAKPAILWVGLIFSAVLFLTPSLTGHARAAAGEYRLAIVSDWLHLFAAGIWVGGLFHLALTLPLSVKHLRNAGRLRVLARAIPLFSRIAVAATVLITVSGIYNSWIHVDSASALWNTTYGQVLTIKIILFLPMLALGALNTFVLRPRENRLVAEAISADEHLQADRTFYRSVRIEAAFGVVVLLLAALLAFLPPARIHEMAMPDAAASYFFRNDR